MGNIHRGDIYEQYPADELSRHVFVYRLLGPDKDIAGSGHRGYFRDDYDNNTELRNLPFCPGTSGPDTFAVYRLHSSNRGLCAVR
jgi:hypothetical protein